MKELKGLTPSDCLNILWRRRWYAVVAFVLVVGGVVVYATSLPDLYISTSMISVEPPPIPKEMVRPSDVSTTSELITTAMNRIRSRSFIEPIVKEFGLGGHGTSEKFSMGDAVFTVGKHIKLVSPSPNTLSISYTATDPQLAQDVTGSIVEMLIRFGSSKRKSNAMIADQFLEEEVQQKENALKKQEEKIKRFREDHMGQLPEKSAQNAEALKQLEKDLDETDDALEDLQAELKSLELLAQDRERIGPYIQGLSVPVLTPSTSGVNSEDTSTLDARLAAKEAELSALEAKYSSIYPDVVRVRKERDMLKKQLNQRSAENLAASDKSASTPLGDDMDSVDVDLAQMKVRTDLIRDDIEKQQKKKESLMSQIQTYQESVELGPELERQLSVLNREKDRLDREYDSLVSKRAETQLTASLEMEGDTNAYNIVDPANFPEDPDSPDRRRIALMGLFAGLVIGIGVTFGRELLDSTLSTEEETVETLNMPVLVSVYEISKRDARRHASRKNIA